jgi:hypothetical protein
VLSVSSCDYLEPGTPILVSDLEAWEKFANVKIGRGDALFIRTGRWARRDKLEPWNVGREAAGRPIHTLAIAVLGVPLVDNGYFEDAAREAAQRRRWDFLMTVQFTKLQGGTATNFNALGIF